MPQAATSPKWQHCTRLHPTTDNDLCINKCLLPARTSPPFQHPWSCGNRRAANIDVEHHPAWTIFSARTGRSRRSLRLPYPPTPPRSPTTTAACERVQRSRSPAMHPPLISAGPRAPSMAPKHQPTTRSATYCLSRRKRREAACPCKSGRSN